LERKKPKTYINGSYRGGIMKLTEDQMIAIIKEKRISNCTQEEREQVMNFAFGEDFMKGVNNAKM
jgi:hypothetical protein